MADPTPADRSRTQPVPLAPVPERELLGAPLPTPLTSFVGRQREVAAVVALLHDPGARLVTLTGPGGVGKTRLALRASEEVAPGFADGVAFVDLSPLRDPARVLPAIAQALGVREGGDRPLATALAAALQTAGVDMAYVFVPEADHFTIAEWALGGDFALAFLRRHLRPDE